VVSLVEGAFALVLVGLGLLIKAHWQVWKLTGNAGITKQIGVRGSPIASSSQANKSCADKWGAYAIDED
jgi:hypothetical protein